MSIRSPHRHDACCLPAPATDRRSFLTLATLAAGVALMAPAGIRPAAAAGSVEALLLTCMDYRLIHEVAAYMEERGMIHKYDQIILAGASLGALTNQKPEWGKEFWDHVAVAKDLHHIRKIIVMDHRDCGAYKVFLGDNYASDPAKETEIHSGYLRQLAAMIKERHPDLEVELLLMALDGTVMPISEA